MDFPQTVICLGIDENGILSSRGLVGAITIVVKDVGLNGDTLLDLELLVLELVVELYNVDILLDILGYLRRNEGITLHIETTPGESAKANPPLLAVDGHEDEIVLGSVLCIGLTTLLRLDNELVEELYDGVLRKIGSSSVHRDAVELCFVEHNGTAAVSLTAKLRDLIFIIINHT